MSPEDFSKVATSLAWPVFALLCVGLFYGPLIALMKRLSETLTFKSLKVKALGFESELTAEHARTVLHELLDDITESTNDLSADEIKLFDKILAAQGQKKLIELVPNFTRKDPDGNHDRLRNLRDRKLIIPAERGQWQPEKHPIVTRYGTLVSKLRTVSAPSVKEFQGQ